MDLGLFADYGSIPFSCKFLISSSVTLHQTPKTRHYQHRPALHAFYIYWFGTTVVALKKQIIAIGFPTLRVRTRESSS